MQIAHAKRKNVNVTGIVMYAENTMRNPNVNGRSRVKKKKRDEGRFFNIIYI
jgi:hypothetical protein